MDRLLGHLAQYASFWDQGELLCTQALAYLLRNEHAERAFSDFICASTGCAPFGPLEWWPELTQADGGRPDLEGRDAAGMTVAMVEAKLEAAFGDGQLESYIRTLSGGEVAKSLLLLIPGHRRREVTGHMSSHFRVGGNGPWMLPDPNVRVAVITWEEVFDALEGTASGRLADDLGQFRAMYRVFVRDDIEPITTDAQVLAWREREDWWQNLMVVAARHLTVGPLPRYTQESNTEAYALRYICRKAGPVDVCYSLGLRDPFEGYTTPIWLRFHNRTGHFTLIRTNLEQAIDNLRIVRSGGHLWLPLDVPRESSRDTMIGALVEQVQHVTEIAYRDLPETG